MKNAVPTDGVFHLRRTANTERPNHSPHNQNARQRKNGNGQKRVLRA